MKELNSKNIKNRNMSARMQSGFSLIEVMIAAVVLSIGILGIAGLQIVAMKGTHQSYMKQQAMGIIHSLTERMHSNKQAVIASNYVVDSSTFDCNNLPVCSTSTSNCSVADIAQVDLHNLICGYQVGAGKSTGGVETKGAPDIAILVDGELDVSCPIDCSTGDVQITVAWTERGFKDETIAAQDSIVINTRILP